jgi:hypothetical protein
MVGDKPPPIANISMESYKRGDIMRIRRRATARITVRARIARIRSGRHISQPYILISKNIRVLKFLEHFKLLVSLTCIMP